MAEDVVDRLQDGSSRHLQRPVHNGPDMPHSVAAAGFTAYIDELLKLLRSGTKAVAKAVEEFIQSIIKWIDELLATLKPPAKEELLAAWDEVVRVSGRSKRRLGQKLKKKDLEKAELYLKWKKCDLQLFPERGTFEIEGFTLADGRAALFNDKASALFVYDGVKTKMCLREGATIYEFFHEYMHLRHSKDLGLKAYHKLSRKDTPGEGGKYAVKNAKVNYKVEVTGIHNLNHLGKYARIVKGTKQIKGKLPTGEIVYEAYVEAYVKELKKWVKKPKESTFFPKAWSEEKISAVIKEASENIVFSKGTKRIGKTAKGIKIEFYVDDVDPTKITSAWISI